MFSKINSFQISLVTVCLGLQYGSARPQFFKTLSSQSALDISPSFSPNQGGIPDYFNLYKQLSDSAHQPTRTSKPLKVEFDPKSLRVSRVAERPTRPARLDPMEQMRLQQEYADRSLREQQLAAHGLGRSKPKGSPPAPAPVSYSTPFKPFPPSYNFKQPGLPPRESDYRDPSDYRGPTVAHFSGPNFDPVGPDYDGAESEESEELSSYRRPLVRSKKTGPRKSYAYDERLFR